MIISSGRRLNAMYSLVRGSSRYPNRSFRTAYTLLLPSPSLCKSSSSLPSSSSTLSVSSSTLSVSSPSSSLSVG